MARFIISTETESFEFISESTEQRDRWEAAINYVIKNRAPSLAESVVSDSNTVASEPISIYPNFN